MNTLKTLSYFESILPNAENISKKQMTNFYKKIMLNMKIWKKNEL